MDKAIVTLRKIAARYRFFEVAWQNSVYIPTSVSNSRKFIYVNRQYWLLFSLCLVGFFSAVIGLGAFLVNNPVLGFLWVYFVLTILYYGISMINNINSQGFDLSDHRRVLRKWRHKQPSVDVFLPTAGESLDVLENTWEGVTRMRKYYRGKVTVYSLDDSASPSVKALAQKYNFVYLSRRNRGHYKKAGNLRYGFKRSKGEFILILDADFRPRYDMISTMVPYMYDRPKAGIVQSAQYFETNDAQNWIERGAGAVQEIFYRFVQVSRQSFGGAICVGTCALYRRKALNQIGGNTLIEHSEDVHTGFDLKRRGWNVEYLPLALAKGTCPDTLQAFFKQQYRWCMGSMSLLASRKFWSAPIGLRTRMAFFSGFLYYLHTAMTSIYVPIIPLYVLLVIPESVHFGYTLFLVPALVLGYVLFPWWHRSIYGIEARSITHVYGWAHLFALVDKVRSRPMGWQATGAVKGKDNRYVTFAYFEMLVNFLPTAIWVTIALDYTFIDQALEFAPMAISGFLYLAATFKISVYNMRTVMLPSLRFVKWRITTNLPIKMSLPMQD